MADEFIFPVTLRLVARVFDANSGDVLEEIEVDNSKPAPMQEINVRLDQLGYSSLFHAGHAGWAVTNRGARRV